MAVYFIYLIFLSSSKPHVLAQVHDFNINHLDAMQIAVSDWWFKSGKFHQYKRELIWCKDFEKLEKVA